VSRPAGRAPTGDPSPRSPPAPPAPRAAARPSRRPLSLIAPFAARQPRAPPWRRAAVDDRPIDGSAHHAPCGTAAAGARRAGRAARPGRRSVSARVILAAARPLVPPPLLPPLRPGAARGQAGRQPAWRGWDRPGLRRRQGAPSSFGAASAMRSRRRRGAAFDAATIAFDPAHLAGSESATGARPGSSTGRQARLPQTCPPRPRS
jgi:hypothetical protein